VPLDRFIFFIRGQEVVNIFRVHVDGRKWEFFAGVTNPEFLVPVGVSKTDLIYLSKENPHLPHPDPGMIEEDLPPRGSMGEVLNPNHPWHSELLAVAIKAWIELYSTREGSCSDNTYKPPGGHIAMIEKHLQESGGQPLSKASVEYLAKVINPSKSGGASATQE
jgi:hypothetical protein